MAEKKDNRVAGRNYMGPPPPEEKAEVLFGSEDIVWSNPAHSHYGKVVSPVTKRDKWCYVIDVDGIVDKEDHWRTKNVRIWKRKGTF